MTFSKKGDGMSINDPRISVNKLAEYMVSKAARQRKLLRDRKYPDPDFQMGMYHKEASEAIAAYLTGDHLSTQNIDAQIQIIKQQNPGKIGTQRRLNSNIEAMERFLDMLDDFDFGDHATSLGGHAPQKLTYHNVAISVRPEIILRGEKKGKKIIGAVKLHFAKGFQMDDDSAGYVSAAVNEFCIRHVAEDDETVSSELCQVFDIGSGNIFAGVKATKSRLKDIEDTCRNIADIWPNI
jgi:hypothetical protein